MNEVGSFLGFEQQEFKNTLNTEDLRESRTTWKRTHRGTQEVLVVDTKAKNAFGFFFFP